MANIDTSGRFVGDWPKIGIRPAIDGRQHGVRESLEGQTRAMARARRTSSGPTSATLTARRSRCVIADHYIGGVSEAAKGAEKFRREGVGRLAHGHALLVLRLRDDGHGPAHAQGGLGLQRHRAARRGLPGGGPRRPQARRACRPSGSTAATCRTPATASSPPTCRRSSCGSRAAGLAAATMRGKSYLAMGGVSMGIAGSIVDQPFFERLPRDARRDRRHVRVHRAAWSEGIYDQDEYERGARAGRARTARRARTGTRADKRSSREQKDRDWEIVRQDGADRARPDGRQPAARGARASARRRMGRNAIAGGFQGQRQWTDHFPNGDFLEAILTLSFDWNGIRPPLHRSPRRTTRLNGASMLLGVPAHQPGAALRRRAHLLEPGGGRAGHRPPPGRACRPAASST